MTQAKEYRSQLSRTDAERMARLSEEVRGRLEEMASIAARTLGVKLDKDAIRKFVPHPAVLDRPTIVEVEILDDFLGPGHAACCLVALSDEDWFVECPCGAGGELMGGGQHA